MPVTIGRSRRSFCNELRLRSRFKPIRADLTSHLTREQEALSLPLLFAFFCLKILSRSFTHGRSVNKLIIMNYDLSKKFVLQTVGKLKISQSFVGEEREREVFITKESDEFHIKHFAEEISGILNTQVITYCKFHQ